jgi:hypothetical protein
LSNSLNPLRRCPFGATFELDLDKEVGVVVAGGYPTAIGRLACVCENAGRSKAAIVKSEIILRTKEIPHGKQTKVNKDGIVSSIKRKKP